MISIELKFAAVLWFNIKELIMTALEMFLALINHNNLHIHALHKHNLWVHAFKRHFIKLHDLILTHIIENISGILLPVLPLPRDWESEDMLLLTLLFLNLMSVMA